MKEKRWEFEKDVGCISFPLTAGRLSLKFDHGRLTDFCYGGICVLKEIYFALRDQNWRTIPFVITGGFAKVRENSFRVEFQARHRQVGILFDWNGCIAGGGDSTVRYSFTGTSGSEFERNRLGFCVLHPDSCAGNRCVVTHGGSVREDGFFPELIAPHQPFFDIRAVASYPDPRTCLEVKFDGEVFEMEDQRNWTDASFKTYCTPLGRLFPVTVHDGETLYQAVTVSLKGTHEPEGGREAEDRHEPEGGHGPEGARSSEVKRDSEGKGAAHVILGPGECNELLPSLGCCIKEVPTKRQQTMAESMRLGHLRYDYFFGTDGASEKKVEKIAEWLVKTDIKLVLAIHFPDDAEKRLEKIRALVRRIRDIMDSVIVYGVGNTVPNSDLAARLKREAEFEAIRVGSGTDAFFTQLNRQRPDASAWDFVSYSNNPQVHAFDDRSVMETIEGQRWNIRSCRAMYRNPIYITPITLKMRWNPDAAKPREGQDLYEEAADARQTSPFLAVWTLRSICMMVQEKAALATYCALTGPGGVMGDAEVYPVGRALAFAGHFSRCGLSARWDGEMAALYAEKGGKHYGLLGNCTEECQTLVFSDSVKGYEVFGGENGWLTIDPDSEFILPAYSMLCVDFSK